MQEKTNDSQSAKHTKWPIVIVVGFTIVVIINAFGAKSAMSYWKAVQRTKMPHYSLEVNGDQLVFRTIQVNKPEVFKTIATLPKSNIIATQLNQELTIKVGDKIFTHPAAWRDGFIVSSKNRTVFFKQRISRSTSKSGGSVRDNYVFYRWDEIGGFRMITPQLDHIMNTMLSLDESSIFSSFSGKVSPSSGAFIYTISTAKTDFVSPSAVDGAEVIIDPENIIVMVPVQLKNGDYHVEHRAYNLKTKTYMPFYSDPTVVQVIGFNGSIWCRAESPGKQSVLRLNKSFDKVEERFDFPATNPEP